MSNNDIVFNGLVCLIGKQWRDWNFLALEKSGQALEIQALIESWRN
jgi:hypothetical protein